MRTVLVAALAVVAVAPAAAQPAPLRVVVRLAEEGDDDLLTRLRGHASDLDVELDSARGPLERGLRAQLAAARALAEARGARVVVWFEPAGAELLVYVAEPAAGRLLTRRLDAGGASALREAAALVVRTALRALADGGQIGVVTENPPPRPRGGGQGGGAAATTHWSAAAGLTASADGAAQPGLAARLTAQRGPLTLAVTATAGLPSERRDDLTTVELSRHAAGVAVGLAARPGRVQLGAALALAAVGYARATTEVAPGLMATPGALTVAFAVGPEGRLVWLPHRAVGLELTVGVDLVVGAPELTYNGEGGAQVRDRLWPVQPRAGVAVVVRGP